MNAQALGKRDVHLKILGVQESDISKFHTEDLQIRGTVQTIVAPARYVLECYIWFVNSFSSLSVCAVFLVAQLIS